MESLMGIVKSERARPDVRHPRGGGAGPVRVHRGRLQQGEDTFGAGLSQPRRVRRGQLAQGKQPLEGGVEGVNGIGVDSDSSGLLEGVEARILAVDRDWDSHRPANDDARRDLDDLLLRWSEGVVRFGSGPTGPEKQLRPSRSATARQSWSSS